jgi:hypothetical protein
MVYGLTDMVEMISSLHKDIDGKHVSQGLGVLLRIILGGSTMPFTMPF